MIGGGDAATVEAQCAPSTVNADIAIFLHNLSISALKIMASDGKIACVGACGRLEMQLLLGSNSYDVGAGVGVE